MEGRREDRAQVMLEEDFEAHHNRDPYFRTIEFHAHDFLELYLFLDGSVTYYIEDQVYDLCPGDLLIIPPGRMHRPVIANERAAYERMVLWVELDYIARIDSAAGELQAALRGIGANGYRVPLRGDDLIFAASLFRRIVKMERGGVFTSSAIRLYLKDAFEAYSLVEKEARGETAVIPQVIRYLTEHFREPLRLDDLAARFFHQQIVPEPALQGVYERDGLRLSDGAAHHPCAPDAARGRDGGRGRARVRVFRLLDVLQGVQGADRHHAAGIQGARLSAGGSGALSAAAQKRTAEKEGPRSTVRRQSAAYAQLKTVFLSFPSTAHAVCACRRTGLRRPWRGPEGCGPCRQAPSTG